MKITTIETIPVRVPIVPQFQIKSSLGQHFESPFVLLKVYTDEGLYGTGEVSCTPVWSGEDQVTSVHIIQDFLAPALAGENPLDIERLTIKMRRVVAGHPFTKSGVEIAIWDILGKAAGLPVYRLLGGPVRDKVPIKMSVSGVEPNRAAELATWAMHQRLRALKVKVGLNPDDDVARVKAVRAAVGPGFRVGVDANGGWSPPVAIQTIHRLWEFNSFFAGQPVAPLAIALMADARRNVPVPGMTCKSCYSLQSAIALSRAGTP